MKVMPIQVMKIYVALRKIMTAHGILAILHIMIHIRRITGIVRVNILPLDNAMKQGALIGRQSHP